MCGSIDRIDCYVGANTFVDGDSSTLPLLRLVPRPIEEEIYINSLIWTPQWEVAAVFNSQQELLLDDNQTTGLAKMLFSGPSPSDDTHFSVRFKDNPGTQRNVSCGNDRVELIVEYDGPRVDDKVVATTLQVDGLHASTNTVLSAELDILLSFYDPEVFALPPTSRFDTPAPCGGHGPGDSWSVVRRVLLVNEDPSTARVDAFRVNGVGSGSISVDVISPPGTSFAANDIVIGPGEVAEFEATWSGTGAIAVPEEAEIEFDVTDITNSLLPYRVKHNVRLTFASSCAYANLIAASLLNFGVTEIGRTTSATIAVRATGTTDLEIMSVSPCSNGPSNPDFSYTGPISLTVPNGGTQALTFDVAPTVVGPTTACFEVVSNDQRGPHEINMIALTADRRMLISPDELRFREFTDRRSFQVINTGALPIEFLPGDLAVSAPFELYDTSSNAPLSFPIDIPAGQIFTVEVRFPAGYDGSTLPFNGTVVLNSNPADLPTVSGSVAIRFEQ
jgi:hypothetical protein